MTCPVLHPQITMDQLQKAYPHWSIRMEGADIVATNEAGERLAAIRSQSLIHIEYQIWRRENVNPEDGTL